MSNKMALDALTPLTRDETEHGREYFDAHAGRTIPLSGVIGGAA